MSSKKLILDPLENFVQEKENQQKENIHTNNKIQEKLDTVVLTEKKQRDSRLYGFYLPGDLADKLSKYCFWLQKTRSEAVGELLVSAFKVVEKNEPLLEIPLDRNFRKVLREVKENITQDE